MTDFQKIEKEKTIESQKKDKNLITETLKITKEINNKKIKTEKNKVKIKKISLLKKLLFKDKRIEIATRVIKNVIEIVKIERNRRKVKKIENDKKINKDKSKNKKREKERDKEKKKDRNKKKERSSNKK